MLFLDETLPEISRAKKEHIKYVTCRISKRLWNISCADPTCAVCSNTSLLSLKKYTAEVAQLATFLRSNGFLNAILAGKPYQLIMMSNSLWSQMIPNFTWGTGGYEDYIKYSKLRRTRTAAENHHYNIYHNTFIAFQTVFEYNNWFGGDKKERYDAYVLAENLNRNTCTYCNRIYTHTVEKKAYGKVTRPQFDHWYSKSKHPALALSFFNLVPSCSVCNSSVKGTLDFELATHMHPYVDVTGYDKFHYSYYYNRSTRRYHIEIVDTDPTDVRIKNTFDNLKLKEVYDTHYAELSDLIKIRKAYSLKYIQRMRTLYSKMNLSEKEVYRLAFGVELDAREFYKRPLSKFKSDILKELKVIK